MPNVPTDDLQFIVFHDEDVEIYVNGIRAGSEPGFVTTYVPIDIGRNARAELMPGAKIILAVHCHQTEGGQGIDVGVAKVTEAK